MVFKLQALIQGKARPFLITRHDTRLEQYDDYLE